MLDDIKSPEDLRGYDAGDLRQIADDLHDPSNTVAKSVLGTANFATAAICSLTNDQPASACTSTVRALQAKI